jgi:hypothetical protein
MRLQKIRERAGLLLAALDTGEQRLIQVAQENFSKAVEEAWQAYQNGEIETQVGGQALPRSMYLYATRELPQEVIHLRRWSMVEREITGFVRLMDRVIVPTENRRYSPE